MASDHHALDPMRGVLLACGLAWPFTAKRGRRRAACGRRARLAGQHRGVAIAGPAGVSAGAGGVRRSGVLQSLGTVRGTRPDRSRNAARRRSERDATLPAQNRAERRRVGRAGSRCLRELLDAGGPRPGQVDLPRVAALIAACLPTRLHFVSYRNNAFDTHVQQVDPHQRMLTCLSGAVTPVRGGQYGEPPDLARRTADDNRCMGPTSAASTRPLPTAGSGCKTRQKC